MITTIPENQICQAFDPRMIMENQILKNNNVYEQPNTSCIAPAYVYIEGKHGNKFLCDTHYYLELYMNKYCYSAPNHSWEQIQQFIIDETEKVKETFAKNVTTTETLGHKCSVFDSFNKGEYKGIGCSADAFVKINVIKIPRNKVNFITAYDPRDPLKDYFYCNFHFRRTYYRFVNNGVIFENHFKIVDERSRMTMTLSEEVERLTYV